MTIEDLDLHLDDGDDDDDACLSLRPRLDGDELPDLGPCCCCGTVGPTVKHIVCLPRRAPIPGFGWGCIVCGLPPDGAFYVACDACVEAEVQPERVVLGPGTNHRRFPIQALDPETFDHDEGTHARFSPYGNLSDPDDSRYDDEN